MACVARYSSSVILEDFLDVAFAVALDRSGHPLMLVIEIGMTGPGEGRDAQHRALGLLSLEHPDESLASTFLLAHQALHSPHAVDVHRLPQELVQQMAQGEL